MTRINTFTKIIIDELEHIVHDSHNRSLPNYLKKTNPVYITNFIQLENLTLTKKYNLIYSDSTFEIHHDPQYSRQLRTDAILNLARKNPDKIFMVIDHDRINFHVLEQLKNCQVWKRKYFSDCYDKTARKLTTDNEILKERTHWFCASMGRADVFRTTMFHWFHDTGLIKYNKISYLSTPAISKSNPTRTIDPNVTRPLYMSTGGRLELQSLIPFNNFEKEIPNMKERIDFSRPVFDCLFNIVMEGFLIEGNTDISEKSLDAIIHGNIPLIMSAPGTMKKFQDMGMIVPDYIKWHLWDDLPIDQPNYNKIDMIQRQLLQLFQKHKINDIAEDWYPYAIRNYKKFKDLESRCLDEEKEICRWILTTIHNLSNPKFQYLYQ